MKITGIEVFQVDAPIPGGEYRLSGARVYTAFDVSIVAVHTDAGITGWGELGTLGTNYLPAYGRGARTAIGEIGPALIGESPLELGRIDQTMDRALAGHTYARSPLDIACWDILGKASGLPVCALLGGHFGGPIDLVNGVPTDTPEAMAEAVARYAAQGYRCHSLKLGGDVHDDIARIRVAAQQAAPGDEVHADCNGGWTVDQAVRVMRSVADLDVCFEQPCASYEECRAVRRRTTQPIILDEVIHSVQTMLRVAHDRVADVINVKISRMGGLTRARELRSICLAAGIRVSLQDTGGGGLTQAAILHLAQSTPERLRHSLYNPLDHCEHPIADNGLAPEAGRLEAPSGPGLGIEPPSAEVLGDPVLVID